MIKKLILILLLVDICLAQGNMIKPPLGNQIDWSHPLSRGLVGHWLLNEGGGNLANDLSGNGNHGTITGGTWSGGKFGPCVDLDGTGDYIAIGSGSFGSPQTYSLVMWFNGQSPAGDDTLICRGAYINPIRVRLNDYASPNMQISVTFRTSADYYIIYTPRDVNINVWHQLVFTYQSGLQQFYIDGKYVTGDTKTGTVNWSANAMVIGSIYDGSGNYWDGCVDSVSLYSRAISPSEITWLYREPFAMFQRERPELYVSAGEEEPAVGRVQVIFISGIPIWVTLALVTACVLDMRQRRRAA